MPTTAAVVNEPADFVLARILILKYMFEQSDFADLVHNTIMELLLLTQNIYSEL